VRFGYFLYPFGLLGWLALNAKARVTDRKPAAAGLVPPQATVSTQAQTQAQAQAQASVEHVVGDS
jgi:hypothetical protein